MDGEIYHDLLPIFEHFDYKTVRRKAIEGVDALVDAKILTQWSQYKTLLDPFDEHDSMREGQEGLPEAVVSDAESEVCDVDGNHGARTWSRAVLKGKLPPLVSGIRII